MELDGINQAEPFGAARVSAKPRRRSRQWTEAEKLAIVEESYSSSGPVTATARRHGVSTSALSRWRQAYRESQFGGDQASAGFVPAEVVADVSETFGRMEIVSANGRRVLVGNDFDAAALSRLLNTKPCRRARSVRARLRHTAPTAGV
ncbi:transposase [Nitratireductor sp. XY-223]|uniref:IS66-like element accessory protein TnpA n=1 Tax=Nitratireductor sp. XY-223 TaxID=2561926 RepID=UPI0010A9BE0D|nr:transposase [Nitratireductor sp. XY-223]